MRVSSAHALRVSEEMISMRPCALQPQSVPSGVSGLPALLNVRRDIPASLPVATVVSDSSTLAVTHG